MARCDAHWGGSAIDGRYLAARRLHSVSQVKRKRGRKVHMAVDTLGLLLAAHITPASEQERGQVGSSRVRFSA